MFDRFEVIAKITSKIVLGRKEKKREEEFSNRCIAIALLRL